MIYLIICGILLLICGFSLVFTFDQILHQHWRYSFFFILSLIICGLIFYLLQTTWLK